MDTLLYDELSVENIDQFVRYEGLENLNKGLENGKGVILLHPHFGNEEYLMPAMGHKGFSVSQIASRWEPDYLSGPLFALANRIRRTLGECVLTHGKDCRLVLFISIRGCGISIACCCMTRCCS